MGRRALVASVVAVLVAGCSTHGGGGGGSSSIAATRSTTAPSSSGATPTLLAAPDVVPVVCVHGITAETEVFEPFDELYGPGRVVVKALYAREADLLQPGDLPRACVVDAGYYRESASTPKYGAGDASIGGAPLARTDSYASRYPQSYTMRLARIVDGVLRASGSDRVDLICHSMGNIVGRAYIKWHSAAANGGPSKVRRYLALAGPHRGINAVEAYSIGFSRAPAEEFMRQGEIAEMCNEYPVWSGHTFIEQLNDDWDGFCQKHDVTYGGVSAIGARGTQVDPSGSTSTIDTIAVVVVNILKAVINVNAIADLVPFSTIFMPAKLVPESIEALGPGDRVVRLASSRLDRPPFQRAVFFAQFEGRHQGNWNTEQAVHGATFTAELARQFVAENAVPQTASVASCDLVLVDSPGEASFLTLETDATGLTAAQIVEEHLDASGNPTGGAQGFGLPIKEGAQSAFLQVPPGGGERRYHVVLYGPNGAAFTKDFTFTLQNGALEAGPRTVFTNATPSPVAGGAVVHATFASNSTDPSLGFSFRLDGGAWSAWGASPTFDTPALGPGEHRLEARARHADDGARVLVEDARGAAVGLFVEASGRVTVRR